ncbi:Spo0E family sporulation regulatory protein-aspartic acid phosphatase [Marinicrinis lubricantis]|uniref:Spo0E family sporulation regulatory protein-aspartic acid phosphatase n=1 Tax=Marinicrinis lubricantis TaxID=2086470 RepID=A0ABW1IM70_9BACL
MELWIGGSDIDDRQLQQLIVEIEVVREQLIQLSLQSGTIKDAKIIKKSEELDVLIVKYHKLQRASKKS